MISFHLVETITKDKLIHQGIFYPPSHKAANGKENRALLWVHGLTSTFYGHIKLLEEFAKECEKLGYGFAAFNNRGHDGVTGVRKVDKRKPNGYAHVHAGAGYELFKDSVFDIDAGIDFLVRQGFSQVILLGHSTGANKVSFYAATKRNPHLLGVVLASPASDRLTQLNSEQYKKDLAHSHTLINQGKGDKLITNYLFFPMTPKRFVSLMEANTPEDQFDYGDPRSRMKYVSKIKKPLLVVFGNKDESLDRPAKKILDVFDTHQHSQNYKSIIIDGALHSYQGHESPFVGIVLSWVSGL